MGEDPVGEPRVVGGDVAAVERRQGVTPANDFINRPDIDLSAPAGVGRAVVLDARPALGHPDRRQRDLRVGDHRVISHEVQPEKRGRTALPRVGDDQEEMDRWNLGGTEGDRHFLQGCLAAHEAPVFARDGERLVTRPGGHRAVHVVLEQGLQLGTAAPRPLFRARDGLAVEADQGVGQIGSDRELRHLGEFGGRRGGGDQERGEKPEDGRQGRQRCAAHGRETPVRYEFGVDSGRGSKVATVRPPGHLTVRWLLREWDRIAIMGGLAVRPEIVGRVPVREDSHRRPQQGRLRSLQESQRRMSVTADPTVPAAPAADPFTDLLIDPHRPGPIRAELFGLERLEEHGRRLAAVCSLEAARRANSPLLRRFADNGRFLVRAHEQIVEGGHQDEDCRGLAAEWLVDNFHIVEEVLREVKQDLPTGYDEELPKLAVGPARGYPRVHAVALALVAHNDSELDEARIVHYVQAFQEVTPLTIGELTGPSHRCSGKLVLLENHRLARGNRCSRLGRPQACRELGRRSAGRETSAHAGGAAASHLDPDGDRPVLAPPPFHDPTDAAVVRLLQLLRDKGLAAAAALSQIETQLEALGTDANEVLRREHRRQAVNQVSVANCAISLRVLSAIDWNEFFEQQSQVERTLREDPAGVYAHQDFATRDRYRRIVEEIARGADVDEQDVVRYILDRARASLGDGTRQGHVGYYLVDRGLETLKARFRPALKWTTRAVAAALAHPLLTYFGAIFAVIVPLLVILAVAAAAAGASAGALLGLVLVLVLPLSELASRGWSINCSPC